MSARVLVAARGVEHTTPGAAPAPCDGAFWSYEDARRSWFCGKCGKLETWSTDADDP